MNPNKDMNLNKMMNLNFGKKKVLMGPMRFELMTSRLSAGRTTWLCYGPRNVLGLPYNITHRSFYRL